LWVKGKGRHKADPRNSQGKKKNPLAIARKGPLKKRRRQKDPPKK